MPGDGSEFNTAKLESADELRPWMEWAREKPTVRQSEEDVRRARAAFLERSDLMLLLFSKGTDTLVGSSGLHRIDWRVPKFEIGYWCRTRFTGHGYITEVGLTQEPSEHWDS
jgi:RimJ/RimL family protein N-acetyltransferase